jgi:hypothetical protein
MTAMFGALVATTNVGAQQDAGTVLARTRAALGGDARIADVKTLGVTGRTVRQREDDTTAEHAFEMAFEAPSRFVRRSVVMAMGPTSIYRHSGFDGDTPIDWIDTPPVLAGGGNVVVRMNWQGPEGDDAPATPEQTAERQRRTLSLNRQDYARLALGLFAAAPDVYPLQFRHAGTAESPEGRADIIAVTGPDGFAANFFVDAATHLPLMVSWLAPKPIEVVSAGGPGEGTRVVRRLEGGPGPDAPPQGAATTVDRGFVEHRLVFADYKTFDGGVKLPTRLQRVIDGRTVEETTFERVRVNQRLDARTFATGN